MEISSRNSLTLNFYFLSFLIVARMKNDEIIKPKSRREREMHGEGEEKGSGKESSEL